MQKMIAPNGTIYFVRVIEDGGTHLEYEFFRPEVAGLRHYDLAKGYIGGFQVFRTTELAVKDVELMIGGKRIELSPITVKFVRWEDVTDVVGFFELAEEIEKIKES